MAAASGEGGGGIFGVLWRHEHQRMPLILVGQSIFGGILKILCGILDNPPPKCRAAALRWDMICSSGSLLFLLWG